MSLIALAIMGVYVYYENHRIGEALNLKEKTEVVNDVKDLHRTQEQAASWIDKDDIGHDEATTSQKQVAQELREPENVLALMANSLFEEDVELFSKVFEAGQLSSDLLESDNANKIEVLEELMQAISRDGSLEDIALVDEGYTKDSYRTKVSFLYSDGIHRRVDLHMNYSGEDDKEVRVLMITDSLWDIANQIN